MVICKCIELGNSHSNPVLKHFTQNSLKIHLKHFPKFPQACLYSLLAPPHPQTQATAILPNIYKSTLSYVSYKWNHTI